MMDVYLSLNGHELVVEGVAAHANLVGLRERGELEFAAVGAWLREHVPTNC